MEQTMFKFWLDKPIPYCCRDYVPKEFQHENQLYELDLYGKVGSTFKGCVNYKEKACSEEN